MPAPVSPERAFLMVLTLLTDFFGSLQHNSPYLGFLESHYLLLQAALRLLLIQMTALWPNQ